MSMFEPLDAVKMSPSKAKGTLQIGLIKDSEMGDDPGFPGGPVLSQVLIRGRWEGQRRDVMTEDFCCSLTMGRGSRSPDTSRGWKRPGSRSYREAIRRNHPLTSGLRTSGTVRS